jgi:hypothetical protein
VSTIKPQHKPSRQLSEAANLRLFREYFGSTSVEKIANEAVLQWVSGFTKKPKDGPQHETDHFRRRVTVENHVLDCGRDRHSRAEGGG